MTRRDLLKLGGVGGSEAIELVTDVRAGQDVLARIRPVLLGV
jgi:hypothetical protein